MFFDTNDFSAENIEVFQLKRNPYKKVAAQRAFHAISFKLNGRAKYDSGENSFTTKTGDILFVPAGVEYIKDTDAELFYVVHFRSVEFLGNKLLRMTPKNPEKFRALFESLYRVYTEKGTAYLYEIKQLFYRLIAELEREYINKVGRRSKGYIDRAVKIIHERFTDPDFTLSTLHEHLNVCDTYLRREFHKHIGESPKSYLMALRLELSKELLRSGYYTVSEVAARCGFSSAYYFSAFFKRATGSSPRDFI